MMQDHKIDWANPRSRIEHYQQRVARMHTEQSQWRSHWAELSRNIQPRMGRYLGDNNHDMGDKRRNNIIDSTGTRALRTMTAGLMAGITSPARPWFNLGTPDSELNEFAPVKEWLNTVQQRIEMVFNKSNIYNSLHRMYEELGLFGTGVLIIDEDIKAVMRGQTLTAGQYTLEHDDTGRLRGMSRKWNMTVHQVVGMFGYKNTSAWVRNAYDRGYYEYRLAVIQFITENPQFREGAIGRNGMQYTSAYWETDQGSGGMGANHTGVKVGERPFLREGGYRDMPMIAPRWDISSIDDVYGRSPGMEALGDVKQLQHQQLRKAEAIDKMVDPPLRAPAELANQHLDTLPGGVTYLSGNEGLAPLYEVQPNMQGLLLDIQDVQRRVDQTFYVDLFRLISNAPPQTTRMTATEVAERHEEKLILLGPALERLHDEGLNPLIDRAFNILLRAGQLPPPPQEIQGSELRVKYISMLAQAQQAVGTASIDRLTGFVGQMAQFNPDVLDKLDMDQATDEYGRMLGVPPKIVRTDDQVVEMRNARAEVQEAQMQQEARGQDAAAAKDQASAATIAGEVTGGAL